MPKPHVWFRAEEAASRQAPPASGPPLTHAKKFGTTRTACDVDAGNFRKHWERQFKAYGPNTCPRCSEVVSGRASPIPIRSQVSEDLQ